MVRRLPRTTPGPVSLLSSGVTAIAGGYMHSLAVQNGGAYAWGANPYGQLGSGLATSSLTPVAVKGLSTGVTAVAGGDYYSLALQDGGVYAWGDNEEGQLGNGTIGYANNSNVPVAVSGMSNGVTLIAAGSYQALAVRNGALYAWGYNSHGALGDGTTTTRTTPVAVPVLTSGVTAIAAGFSHSLAVQNGYVYAWGLNGTGELGDGTNTNRTSPALIDANDLHNIIAVAATEMASYALSSDGSLWDWGDNSNGELGLGPGLSQYNTPKHLLPPTGYRFTSIDGDGYSSHVVATLAPAPEPVGLSQIAFAAGGLLARRRKR